MSGLSCAAALVGELPAVDLATVEADATLAVRTDRKHLLGWADVTRLLASLAPTHAALEIGGRRAFAYDTTYFDTEDLHCFRAHVQGRRRRYKCRTRLYADTDVCALEVKLRGERDQTVKLRRPVAAREHGCLDADGRAFLSDCLGSVPPMAPTLRGHHTRVTLVGDGAYDDVSRDATRREIATWPLGAPVPSLPRMQAITLRVVLRAVLGVQAGPALERLGGLLQRLVGWTTDPRRALVFAFLGPDRLMGLGAFRHQAAELDVELLEEIARRRELADLAERTDILALLVRARADDGVALSDRELRDELLTLLVAGHETTPPP